MFCTYCGTHAGGATVCAVCGAQRHGSTWYHGGVAATMAAQTVPYPYTGPFAAAGQSSSGRTWMVAGLVAVAAVVVGGAVTIAVLLMRDQPANPDITYLDKLNAKGLSSQFASDANAIASAKRTCRTLEDGGPAQGMPAEKIAVDVYCPKFSGGFHVLETATVRGTFTLVDSTPSTYYPAITTTGSSCRGSGGYSDIGPGTEVTVKNANGEVVTSSALGSGSGTRSQCVFNFSFELTEGQDRYLITVSHRGDLTYSFDQLKNNDVALTLGN
jgi:hypothetical protein